MEDCTVWNKWSPPSWKKNIHNLGQAGALYVGDIPEAVTYYNPPIVFYFNLHRESIVHKEVLAS